MNELYQRRLKKFRIAQSKNNTQVNLSDDLDITPEYYSKLESGNRTPSMLLHIDICTKLNKPSDCFFKKDREDIQMSQSLFDYLMSLEQEQLSKILSVLHVLYEAQKL